MSSFEHDGENYLRHQHSASSDLGVRSLIPMWDSSDPERAPPPLPFPPQSPSFTSRAGTSSAIQSAHAALSERVRESTMPTLNKRATEPSPERALIKGGAHRRMQSFQPGSVRDMSMMIEGSSSPLSSPSKSPEKQARPSTPVRSRDSFSESRYSDDQSASSTPTPGPSLTPIIRPTVRRPPPQSILGENTPPQSSTMQALQNMGAQNTSKEADPPLTNITNGVKPPQLDNLSSQILSLTSIATQLQKEMSQLSRRSRDNAADLLSLKEATNTRDEDIRKSLRDLLSNCEGATKLFSNRDSFGGLYLDNKPHSMSPAARGFHLPRIPSPKSFSDTIDQASMSTPSLAGSEAGPPVHLLEKIIRDMGTKEGQETLLDRLAEISEQMSGMATGAKVDELVEFVRANAERSASYNGSEGEDSESRSRGLNLDDEHNPFELAINNHKTGAVAQRVEQLMRNEGRRMSEPSVRGADLLNDDLISIIQSVKDSVTQGGGITAEVKALVRELRGEVLGMGREIGQRLDQQATERNAEDNETPSKDDVARVIDEGLEQMKDQLNHVLREHRRQSTNSVGSQKTAVDYQEIYNAMRAALRDNEASQDMPDLNREDVIEAVREAWENYKPEIEAQQLGLERDEVLACLKEGLQEYASQDERSHGATRDEVFTAVVEGLKHFVPPQVDTPATLSRDEIIEAVRDCLEEFEFPVAATGLGNEITREDMVDAVKEGLQDLDLNTSRDLVPTSGGDEVVSRLHEIMDDMRLEFKAISDEAKQNAAASSRDTEQVLDATKDGFESLRTAIEGYVELATGAAGTEDFKETLMKSLDDFKDEISDLVSHATEDSREQLKTELEGLREMVNSSMVPATPLNPPTGHVEVIEALHTGLNSLRQEIHRPRAETSEILDALNDGMNELRAGIDRVTNKPVDLTANDEILDALRDGLGKVHADIDALRESTGEKALVPAQAPNDELLDTLKSGLESLRSDIEALRDSNAEKAIATLDPPEEKEDDELLKTLKSGLESLHTNIETLRDAEKAAPPSDGPVNQEMLAILKTGLESVRAAIENLKEATAEKVAEGSNTNEGVLSDVKSGLEALRSDIEALRESTVEKPAESPAHTEVLDALKSGLDSIKSDIEVLRDSSADKALATLDAPPQGEVLNDLKTGLDAIKSDIEALRESGADKAHESSHNTEVLDALKSGLDSVRSEIETLRDGSTDRAVIPADQAGKNELLEALKSGLEALRSDIEALKNDNNERALATATPDGDSDKAIMPAEVLKQEDIKNLETLIDKLQAKVDVLEPDANRVQKDDMTRVEEMLGKMKLTIDEINNRDPLIMKAEIKDHTGLEIASKDDVVAIETILRNTKARLDDLMDGEQAIQKDHIDAVEALVLETRESMSSISEQMGAISRKEDVAPLESLVNQVTAGFDEMKELANKESENPERVSKTHLDAVETVVIEIKNALDGFTNSTDFTTISTKEEVAKLEALVNEVKEKLAESNESYAKSIALRDEETATAGERVNELKTLLEEFQSTVNAKFEEGSSGVEVVGKLLQTIGEKVDKNENVSTDLKDMFEAIKAEFEDSKGIIAGARLESDEKMQQATDNLSTKVNDKIGELLSKYEELQAMLDEKSKQAEAREVATEAAITGTKTVAEELKLLTDTLGSTVTDSLEKMEEASKTVFGQVEELVAKTEENHTADKADHEQTRGKIAEAVTVVEALKGEVGEQHPKVLEAVKDVMVLVGEHAEITKSSITEMQGKLDEAQPSEHMRNILPPEKYDNTEVLEKLNKLVEEKYDDVEVRERLDKIIEGKYDDSEVRGKLDQLINEKYDDAVVQEKLGSVQEKLDKIPEEKYDDTAVLEKLAKLVEDKYDDGEVRSKLDKIIEDRYDDILVHEKLDKIVEDKYDDILVHEKLDKVIQEKYDDAAVREKLDQLMEGKYDDTEVRGKLDKLIEEKYDDGAVREKLDTIIEHKYDDVLVHDKLDKLVDHTGAAEQAFTQLATLDQVHESVLKTASELSAFLANQTQRVNDENAERAKALEETNVALERKLAEKEHAEASVLNLREEEERLRQSILNLRTEQESLVRQKTRLTGDLSSLETAMQLRKEELYDMESRAEGLERRILEGVMDHSRVLLMAKASRAGGDAMSRKRVRKSGHDGESSPPGRKSAVNVALAAKRNLASGSARRIASLSQINNNVATGGVKRSQSVRTPLSSKGYRKSSWGGGPEKDLIEDDKENMGVSETVEELDEPETPIDAAPEEEAPEDEMEASEDEAEAPEAEMGAPDDEATVLNSAVDDDGCQSDTGTLRRGSGGPDMDAQSESDYGEDSDTEGAVEGNASGVVACEQEA